MASSLGLVGIADKGVYDASVTYAKGNFVYYNGSTYLCINDNGCTGVEPSDDKTNWKYLAMGSGALATKQVAGVVKIGDGIDVAEDGTISAQRVNNATTEEAGIVKVGDGLNVAEDGTLTPQVDAEINDTSIYPVQNKIIHDALAEKADKSVADTILSNTAQIETAGTATSAHKSGEYVMISNALYKVVADVAAGDAWKIGVSGTTGVNVESCNIGKELSLLKNSSMFHSISSTIPFPSALNVGENYSIDIPSNAKEIFLYGNSFVLLPVLLGTSLTTVLWTELSGNYKSKVYFSFFFKNSGDSINMSGSVRALEIGARDDIKTKTPFYIMWR